LPYTCAERDRLESEFHGLTGRLPEPATDQMLLFTRTPSAQWPASVSATENGLTKEMQGMLLEISCSRSNHKKMNAS
jgi:hypothetical protein